MNSSKVLLEIMGLTKAFPGVIALNNVDFTIRAGEINVLVGENGAGKSTLVNIVTGALIPDSVRSMKLEGEKVSFKDPNDAINAGIGVVRQHFSLIPQMTVAENIFLNQEITSTYKIIDYKKMNREAKELISHLEVDIEPYTLVGDLNPGDQQIVEICKAISQRPKLLLMDEPTSGLKHNEVRRLFEIIQKLKSKGVTILYISHRLEEIFEIGEWVTVLRDGVKIADCQLKELDHSKIIELIVGRKMGKKFPKENVKVGDVIMKVDSLQNSKTNVQLKDISFELHEGEILGIYGILGSGKDLLAETIFGVKPADDGKIIMNGEVCDIRTPVEAIDHRIGYLTDDRSRDGLLLWMTVKENQTIASLKRFSVLDYILKPKERAESDFYIQELDIKTPHREFCVQNLSGGNQQKVVLSKWLISQAQVLILNEPTKGIDVGAKVDVFRMMTEQVKKRSSIIFITSELDEVIGMADRILVMRNGRIVAESHRDGITHDELLRIATMQETEKIKGEII